ncbi:hypothetical protein TNCV_329541 [Trichonephila clavipes]|nr:hypothetical protein TNCV_329541 [Trichonephila clavipes]
METRDCIYHVTMMSREFSPLKGIELNSVLQQRIRNKAYCAYLSLRALGTGIMCRCFGQVSSLTQNPNVQFPSKLGPYLSAHRRYERLS